jgi:hypothetical protein
MNVAIIYPRILRSYRGVEPSAPAITTIDIIVHSIQYLMTCAFLKISRLNSAIKYNRQDLSVTICCLDYYPEDFH